MIRAIKTMCRTTVKLVWYMATATIVLIAVTLSLLRLAGPLVDKNIDSVESMISQALEQPVSIERVQFYWRGLNPGVRVYELSIREPSQNTPIIEFGEASIHVDLIASMRRFKLVPGILSVKGITLNFETSDEGRTSLTGLEQINRKNRQAPTGKAMNWLLQQNRIRLADVKITWKDHRNKHTNVFNKVLLDLSNDGRSHQLRGESRLPARMGKQIKFAIIALGDGDRFQDWDATVYIKCSLCRLPSINPFFKNHPQFKFKSGIADLEMWAKWNEKRLHAVEGQVQLVRPTFESQKQKLLDRVNTLFAWRWNGKKEREGKWMLLLENLQIEDGGEFWPKSNVVIARKDNYFYTQASYAQLGLATHLIKYLPKISDKIRDNMKTLDLKGEVFNTLFVINKDNPRMFYLSGKTQDLNLNPWKKIPKIRGADGGVEINHDHGLIELDSENVAVLWHKASDTDLRADKANGRVVWRRDDNGWQVNGENLRIRHGDLGADGYFNTHIIENNENHFVDAGAHFGTGSLDGVKQYLNLRSIPKQVAKRLGETILEGAIEGGGLIFQGRLKDYPFRENQGKFLLTTQLQRAKINYTKNFPPLENASALFAFDGATALLINGEGNIYDARLHEGRMTVDLNRRLPMLYVSGHVDASTQDGINYLTQSPLKERFNTYMRHARGKGDVNIKLELDLALRGVPKPNISGKIHFNDNQVDLKAVGVKLSQLKGEFEFKNEQVWGSGLKANIWNQPGEFSIRTDNIDKHMFTTVVGEGGLDISGLRRSFPDISALAYAKGNSKWLARLRVRHATLNDDAQTEIRVESDLSGIAIHLPDPIGKLADEQRKFNLHHLISVPNGHTLRFQYEGGLTSGILYGDGGEGAQFNRGEIRLGGREAGLPTATGIRIAGYVSEFSMTDWEKKLFPADRKAAEINQAGLLSLVNQIDVSIQKGEFLGYRFSDVHLSGHKKSPYWYTKVASLEAVGKINYPLRTDDPLVLRMRRLHLNQVAPGSKDTESDPRQLPSIDAQIDNFIYDKKPLGNMVLNLVKQPPGLEINRLEFHSPVMHADVQGRWFIVNKKQKTHFSAQVESEDMGKLLENFGYLNTMKRGKSKLIMDLQWAGKPSDFEYDRLEGEMSIRIENGSLLDIEPGAGRLFGLFSFQALPRRFALDFRDFFQKGFKFDKIHGDFAISNGDAYTGNLVIDGPAASVTVVGRAGLVSKDYDQQITVMPSLASALPLAGVLAGEPQIGAVLLITQKLLDKKLKQVAQYNYSLTGKWSSPVLKRINKKKTHTVVDDDVNFEFN